MPARPRFGLAAGSFASREFVAFWPLRVKQLFWLFARLRAILRLWLRPLRFMLNQPLQIHSLVWRSIALLPGLGLAALRPQSTQRANPSVKRTRSGKPALAFITFSAKPGLPPRAAYLER